jgi:hypothetical protein
MRISGAFHYLSVASFVFVVSALLIGGALVSAAPAQAKRSPYDNQPPPTAPGVQAFGALCAGGSTMSYYFLNGTADISGEAENQAVVDGMKLWSQVADISFVAVNALMADSFIKWAVGEHGDGNPFDGAGGTLAHAFYPCSSPSQDIHFDDDETWSTASQSGGGQPRDLVTVAAHEVGHAIGLEHSSESDALMYPFYSKSHRYLGWDDTLGVQSLYGRANGIFHLRNTLSAGAPDTSFLFQNLKDKPVVADWNGDDRDTPGVYRQSNQTFYLDDSIPPTGGADYTISYGASADLPVGGDWNGDGTDTIGVWRPSNQDWYLRNKNSEGSVDLQFDFGGSGDIPVVGDWNGDGTDTIGVWRPSTATFYLRNSNSEGAANYTFSYGANTEGMIIANPLAVAGDWDANGSASVGLFQN